VELPNTDMQFLCRLAAWKLIATNEDNCIQSMVQQL